MSKVWNVVERDEFDEWISDKDSVVVKFWAEWCGPCKQFAPHFEKTAEQLSDVAFISIDIDKSPWAVEDLGVRGVPTVMFYRNGEYVKNLQERTVIKLNSEISEA